MVLFLIILYRNWQLIQDGYARTTPGRAVGFLFIPFFNLYWIFEAFPGLVHDTNAYIQRHGLPIKMQDAGLATAFCILTLLCLVPYLDVFDRHRAAGHPDHHDKKPQRLGHRFDPKPKIIVSSQTQKPTLRLVLFFDLAGLETAGAWLWLFCSACYSRCQSIPVEERFISMEKSATNFLK